MPPSASTSSRCCSWTRRPENASSSPAPARRVRRSACASSRAVDSASGPCWTAACTTPRRSPSPRSICRRAIRARRWTSHSSSIGSWSACWSSRATAWTPLARRTSRSCPRRPHRRASPSDATGCCARCRRARRRTRRCARPSRTSRDNSTFRPCSSRCSTAPSPCSASATASSPSTTRPLRI